MLAFVRFPGQYFDAETGLHYNRFRYYDPGIGRYVSADPIGQAGGINVYQYAFADPMNEIDNRGLMTNTVDAKIAAGGAMGMFLASMFASGTGEEMGKAAVDLCEGAYDAAQDAFASFGSEVSAASSSTSGSLGDVFGVNINKRSSEQTEGEQATSERERNVEAARSKGIPQDRLGPSGKPKIHKTRFPTRKSAKEAAKGAGRGEPLHHQSPTTGRPHYHPTDAAGRKIPGQHFEY